MLKIKNLNKKLGRFALTDINLEIGKGEYFVLLGRSGSGKTQLLELIAGLSSGDTGEIWLNGRNSTKIRIQDRNVGLVFQDYAVFPNMTVYGNIAYSLHATHFKKEEIALKVSKIAHELNLQELLDRSPVNLSGGELQRVALARTLINNPCLLLLDEPMASIDASLKDDVRRTLRRLNKSGLTIIHVTHDYREAVSLASRVGVIHNGHIIQVGTPEEVFGRPVNKFVARYAGFRNFYRVRFRPEGNGWKAESEKGLGFNVCGNNFPEEGLIVIRNNEIRLNIGKPEETCDNCFQGIIKEINPSGYGTEIKVEADEVFYVELPVGDFKQMKLKESDIVWVSFPKEAAIALSGNG